jgi:hypothetical protein
VNSLSAIKPKPKYHLVFVFFLFQSGVLWSKSRQARMVQWSKSLKTRKVQGGCMLQVEPGRWLIYFVMLLLQLLHFGPPCKLYTWGLRVQFIYVRVEDLFFGRVDSVVYWIRQNHTMFLHYLFIIINKYCVCTWILCLYLYSVLLYFAI